MRHQRISQEESYVCRCSTTSLVDQETMNKNWSFIGSGSEKKSGAVFVKTVHKEYGIILLKGCWWNSQKADVQFSALQVHRPKVGLRAKAMENCRYTIQPIWKRLSFFFAQLLLQISSVFTEQSQKCVKSTKPFMRERDDPLWWDSQVPHSCSVWSRQKYLWIVMTRRIKNFECNNMENELRSCHNKTNWVNFVWMHNFWVLLKLDNISWQYFMTKDTLEQYYAVACREYTLPREERASQSKGWIQGNTNIGLVSEVETSYLHGKYGDEIKKFWSLSEDNTHSWVRISLGSNKFVMNFNNNDTEVPEEQALQLNVKGSAYRSKAKEKPQRREPANFFFRAPFRRTQGIGLILNHGALSQRTKCRNKQSVFFVILNKYNDKRMERFISGELKKIVRVNSHRFLIGLTIGKAYLAARRSIMEISTSDSRIIVYLRALHGHSRRNLIDPSLQDSVEIQSGVFQHVYHRGCALNLY